MLAEAVVVGEGAEAGDRTRQACTPDEFAKAGVMPSGLTRRRLDPTQRWPRGFRRRCSFTTSVVSAAMSTPLTACEWVVAPCSGLTDRFATSLTEHFLRTPRWDAPNSRGCTAR